MIDKERIRIGAHKLLIVIGLMSTGMLAFIFFMYFYDTNVNPGELLGNMMTTSIYKSKAISHLNDNITIEVSQLCNTVPTYQQADCVVSQITPYYKYNYSNHTIYSPDEFVQNGGVCRDIAIVYNTIFSRLGWYTYYEFNVPHHVYLIITKQEDNRSYRCLIDGEVYDCQDWGD